MYAELKHIWINLGNWVSKKNTVYTSLQLCRIFTEWCSSIFSLAIFLNLFPSGFQSLYSLFDCHVLMFSEEKQTHNSVPWFLYSVLFVTDDLFALNGLTALQQSSLICQAHTWSFTKHVGPPCHSVTSAGQFVLLFSSDCFCPTVEWFLRRQ